MQKRNSEIKVRLTKQELQALEKRVKKTGMSREGYVRLLLRDKVPVEIPPLEYFDLIREIRRVGNNLNQIAYKANALGYMDSAYRGNADAVLAAVEKLTMICLPRDN